MDFNCLDFDKAVLKCHAHTTKFISEGQVSEKGLYRSMTDETQVKPRANKNTTNKTVHTVSVCNKRTHLQAKQASCLSHHSLL